METVTSMVGSNAGGITGDIGGIAAGGISPQHARALLAWWQLAGADTPVAPRPAPWTQTGSPAPPAPARARPAARSAPAPPAPAPPERQTFASLADLVAFVSRTAPGAVLADGDPGSGIVILGESPSAEDLRTGRPFTGPAGQLLDQMLAAIGLDRRTCYITLLCPRRRIPGPPDREDVARDLPLTRTHLRLSAPRAVLLLGGTPAQALIGTTDPISKLRGRPLDLDAEGYRTMALATFNPAYLLRRPADKALAWADLLAFRRMTGA